MKIEWEGKEITIRGGTTTIECVGDLMSIESTGDINVVREETLGELLKQIDPIPVTPKEV